MKITWLGHASFRIEIGGQVLLVDPWLQGNPMLPEDRWDEATGGATAILITHGHGDHASSAAALSKKLGVPVACIHELAEGYFASEGVEVIGFGKGGTISFGEVKVTMVNAVHSSSMDFKGAMQPAGSEAGFMVAGEGHVIYVSGDTDIMADMEWMAEYHKPDIGILCAGGHYTMDMDRAAFAAKKYFDFTTVIPCHYRTFPLLEQSAGQLVAALPDVDVLTPEVMQTLEI
jgi:L-ascorbate metabolism protein UlaG (beta-lactamase superfamily)